MKKAIVLLLFVVLMFVSCVATVPVIVPLETGNSAVGITIMEGGISSDSSEVVVKNFYAGARAEMVYRIYNSTSKTIMPEIFVVKDADVADYSKADGAVKAPSYVGSWIELPTLVDVNPGGIKDFVVVLQMPKDAQQPADKIGFQIGVAGKAEGKLQPAVGIWWLVNFR